MMMKYIMLYSYVYKKSVFFYLFDGLKIKEV